MRRNVFILLLSVFIQFAAFANTFCHAADSPKLIPLKVGLNVADIYKGEAFGAMISELGSGMAKVNLSWNNLEPRKGMYDWSLLDRAVEQSSGVDLLRGLRTNSSWGTAPGEAFGRPLVDETAYYNMIYAMVSRAPEVKFWQNDCEPNNSKYWSGGPEEFVVALKTFYAAVKAANPEARVILGGHNGNITEGHPSNYEFYDYVFQNGRDYFDLFDVRLYDNPYTIEGRVRWFRNRLDQFGLDDKPIVSTEYGGPKPQQFPENLPYIEDISAQLEMGTPAKDIYDEFLADMENLPPQLQMFLSGCDPELERRRYRIQIRDMNIRTILAMSAGVMRLYMWVLISRPVFEDADHSHPVFSHMSLSDESLTARYPTFEGYRRMLYQLSDVISVVRTGPIASSVYLFEITREDGSRFYVVWQKRDPFRGEDTPPAQFTCKFSALLLNVVDVFGNESMLSPRNGVYTIAVTDTPVYLEEVK